MAILEVVNKFKLILSKNYIKFVQLKINKGSLKKYSPLKEYCVSCHLSRLR